MNSLLKFVRQLSIGCLSSEIPGPKEHYKIMDGYGWIVILNSFADQRDALILLEEINNMLYLKYYRHTKKLSTP